MKTVLISTQPPCHFSKKIHRLVCVWLAGWLAVDTGACWAQVAKVVLHKKLQVLLTKLPFFVNYPTAMVAPLVFRLA